MRIGYARVSTAEQNTGLQLDALLSAGCERVFEDVGSGADRERVQLAEALAFLRPGDALVVWRLDRLARSLRHLIELAARLEQSGVGLVSLTEAIDTGSPGGRLIFHIFGALAEFERGLLRERSAAGRSRARALGVKMGRPVKGVDGVRLRELAKDGRLSRGDLARMFGVSEATIYRRLRMEARRGA